MNRTLNLAAGVATLAAAAGIVLRLIAGAPLAELPPEIQRPGVEFWQRYSEVYRTDSEPRAAVTVVVFSDYLCRHCRRTFDILEALQARFPGGLEVVARPFPLGGAASYEAAAAAECARGFGRFDEMHTLLFATADDLGLTPWAEVASSAGIQEVALFSECLRGDSVQLAIEESLAHGRDLGVRLTPTILMNHVLLHGNPGERQLEALVRGLLKGEESQ